MMALALPAVAQEAKKEPARQGGASTGGVFAARRDAQKRPITAGGFVDGAPTVFDDTTTKSGLGAFTMRSGGEKKRFILETTSAGLALFDYDGDGWLDVFLLNGSTLEANAGKAPAPRAALYRNRHDGTFEDVTAKAGVANERWGMGCATGAEVIGAACPFCNTMLTDGVKNKEKEDSVKVLDIAELVAASL